jgi:hypothetical protein
MDRLISGPHPVRKVLCTEYCMYKYGYAVATPGLRMTLYRNLYLYLYSSLQVASQVSPARNTGTARSGLAPAAVAVAVAVSTKGGIHTYSVCSQPVERVQIILPLQFGPLTSARMSECSLEKPFTGTEGLYLSDGTRFTRTIRGSGTRARSMNPSIHPSIHHVHPRT